MSDAAEFVTGPGGIVAPVPRGLPVTDQQQRQNVTALERVVLGGMLQDRDVCAEVAGILSAESFIGPGHALIFAACCAQATATAPDGQPAEYSPQTVGNRLTAEGNALAVGGLHVLHDCIAAVPAKLNAIYYARDLAEKAGIRQLGEVFTRGAQAAQQPDANLGDLLTRARFYLDQVAAGPSADTPPTVGMIAPGVMDRILAGPVTGVPVPYTDLERFVRVLEPGLVVIAARPSIGKTVVAGDFARHAAIGKDLPVLMYSLEMSHLSVMTRWFAAEAMVEFARLRDGHLTGGDEAALARTMPAIMNAPLVVDDRSVCSLPIIRMHLNQMRAAGTPAQMVVIDYLQLMQAPKAANRQESVSILSRELHLLGVEYGIPVVVAAQLNRGPEGRTDKKPTLSDLRESGAIEQDASVVILLHRPEFYDKDTEHLGEMQLIVAKNRNGETGEVTVRFLGRHMKCGGATWSPSAMAEDAEPDAA